MPAALRERQPLGRESAGRGHTSPPVRDVPIDWAHLSRFTLKDHSLEQEVLGLFAMEAPRYLAKMHAAATAKEWIEAAHTLKGSARAVGAWTIAECAQAAEILQVTAGGVPPTADPSFERALEELGEAVHSTLAYIEKVRETSSGDTAARAS